MPCCVRLEKKNRPAWMALDEKRQCSKIKMPISQMGRKSTVTEKGGWPTVNTSFMLYVCAGAARPPTGVRRRVPLAPPHKGAFLRSIPSNFLQVSSKNPAFLASTRLLSGNISLFILYKGYQRATMQVLANAISTGISGAVKKHNKMSRATKMLPRSLFSR